MFSKVLEQHKPTVIDADGLFWLAEWPAEARAALASGASITVVTPHAAEAGRLLDVPVAEVQGARLDSARKLAERVAGVAVLKGTGTVLAAHGGSSGGRCIGICAHGNPGMATAGMGDVLSGVIGSFLAQGLEQDLAPEAAAALAVCLHSLAGDKAAERYGEVSLLATDLIAEMVELLKMATTPVRLGG